MTQVTLFGRIDTQRFTDKFSYDSAWRVMLFYRHFLNAGRWDCNWWFCWNYKQVIVGKDTVKKKKFTGGHFLCLHTCPVWIVFFCVEALNKKIMSKKENIYFEPSVIENSFYDSIWQLCVLNICLSLWLPETITLGWQGHAKGKHLLVRCDILVMARPDRQNRSSPSSAILRSTRQTLMSYNVICNGD